MKNIDSLCEDEVIDLFLSDSLEIDSDEYLDAGDRLHKLLTSVEKLIPMIMSTSIGAQRMAVFICAQEGNRAKPLFPILLTLADSPNKFIRDDLCDCFNECASSGQDVLVLLKLLNDTEQSVRLKAISVFTYLPSNLIKLASEYISSSNKQLASALLLILTNKYDLSEALTKYYSENSANLALFIFIMLLRSGSVLDIRKFANKSLNSDFAHYCEVYDYAGHLS